MVGNDRTGSMLAGIRALDNVIPCAQLPLCTQARVYIQIRTWPASRVSREPLPRYIIFRTPSVPGKHRENASSPVGDPLWERRRPMDTSSLRRRDFYSIEDRSATFEKQVSSGPVIRGGPR